MNFILFFRAPLRTRSQWASAAQACIRRCSRGGAGLSAKIPLAPPLHGRLGLAASPHACAWGFLLSASAMQPCYGVTCVHYRSHPWCIVFGKSCRHGRAGQGINFEGIAALWQEILTPSCGSGRRLGRNKLSRPERLLPLPSLERDKFLIFNLYASLIFNF